MCQPAHGSQTAWLPARILPLADGHPMHLLCIQITPLMLPQVRCCLLVSQHQITTDSMFHHAHAAGEHKDAVGVCAREMGDPQLALFLARLLDGRGSPAGASGSAAAPGPLLRGVISAELLPGGGQQRNDPRACAQQLNTDTDNPIRPGALQTDKVTAS